MEKARNERQVRMEMKLHNVMGAEMNISQTSGTLTPSAPSMFNKKDSGSSTDKFQKHYSYSSMSKVQRSEE